MRSRQLLEQEEHIGCVWVLGAGGPPQLHRVEAGVGRCELLWAVKFVQEEPGGVWVYLHQVEENAVGKQAHRQSCFGFPVIPFLGEQPPRSSFLRPSLLP